MGGEPGEEAVIVVTDLLDEINYPAEDLLEVYRLVGEDFTERDETVMRRHGIDTSGIVHARGKSFFCAGEYGENLNEAKTLETQLNVFADFNPQVRGSRRSAPSRP